MKKLILLIPILIFAFVKVNVNKTKIFPGEEVIFTINASGNSIKFPNITKIGPYQVQGTAITQNITILNGNMQKTISKSYIFFPVKSVTIPSFDIKIDSKTVKTKPIHITVTKPSQTKNKNFKIELSANKKTAYLEEPVLFKIKFFQRQDTNPQSIEIQKPNFENFFTKEISKKTYNKGKFSVTEYDFLLIPQKAGNYTIGPILAKIGYLSNSPANNPFFNLVTSSIKYKNIFSNDIKLKILPIPSNTIYGKFKASFSADKTDIKSSEPVKVTLRINGCGDLYDLPDFKLNIPDATIYENAPKLKSYIKNGSLCGTYTKEFTIISNKNITVPSLQFQAFDGNKTETVKTNKIFISVKSSKIKQNPAKLPVITKKEIIYKNKINKIYILITFITGLIIGILIGKFTPALSKENSLYKKIKKADEKELFNILLEYSNYPEIEKILEQLEENIYSGKKNKINKKEIIKFFKSRKIS